MNGLVLDRVSKVYPPAGGAHAAPFEALKGVSLAVGEGTVTAVVGESGAGKSTLAGIASGLIRPSEGRVLLRGKPLGYDTEKDRMQRCRQVRVLSQNPFRQLDSLWTVDESLREVLPLYRPELSPAQRDRAVAEVLERCLLPARIRHSRPAALSGGELQRVVLARALLTQTNLIIADEILSALDTVSQLQVLEIFRTLKKTPGFLCLFVSHDLAAARFISDRIAVMHRGRLVEEGETERIFCRPREDYTKLLIGAVLPFPFAMPKGEVSDAPRLGT